MQVTQVGAAFAVEDPATAGSWFAQHLGFGVLVDLGWFVSTQHPDQPDLRIDFVSADHETWVERTPGVRGSMIALVISDVDEQHGRLVAAGVPILKPLVTEPWGQRRFQVVAPGGLVVELVQPVEPDPAWMESQGLGS